MTNMAFAKDLHKKNCTNLTNDTSLCLAMVRKYFDTDESQMKTNFFTGICPKCAEIYKLKIQLSHTGITLNYKKKLYYKSLGLDGRKQKKEYMHTFFPKLNISQQIKTWTCE